MPMFATAQPITATVEVAGAHVRIVASDRADTVVRVEPADPAKRKDVKVADNTSVELAGDLLSVKTKTPGDKEGSVAVTIELPAGSNLAAYVAYSTVAADGTLGACDLHLASGQVRLDRVGALRAGLSSGDVTIGHVAGRVDVDGAAFTMRIGAVEGTVGLSNSGGRVWIGHAAADLTVRSAGCDFDIDRADGNVSAETASGAIRIGRMTNGRATLKNGSGDIEVGIDAGSTPGVDAKSERGAVHNFVTSSGVPSAPDAMVSVFARTRHGDISIQRVARDPHEASVTSTS